MRTLIFIICISSTFGCNYNNKENKQIKFDSNLWLNSDITKRGQMVDDIIENHLLIGKSTNEVLNLLGETSYGGKSYPYMYQVDFGKKVGPYGLGGRWLFNLRIDFDSSTNKVISVICID